jgi:hypothetical protein
MGKFSKRVVCVAGEKVRSQSSLTVRSFSLHNRPKGYVVSEKSGEEIAGAFRKAYRKVSA